MLGKAELPHDVCDTATLCAMMLQNHPLASLQTSLQPITELDVLEQSIFCSEKSGMLLQIDLCG